MMTTLPAERLVKLKTKCASLSPSGTFVDSKVLSQARILSGNGPFACDKLGTKTGGVVAMPLVDLIPAATSPAAAKKIPAMANNKTRRNLIMFAEVKLFLQFWRGEFELLRTVQRAQHGLDRREFDVRVHA